MRRLLALSAPVLAAGATLWAWPPGWPGGTAGPEAPPAPAGEPVGRVAFADHAAYFEVTADQLDHAFAFRNGLDRPVRVSPRPSSCGCLVSSPEKDVYGPGETGSVRASLRLAGKPPGIQKYRIALAWAAEGGIESGTAETEFAVNNRPELVVSPDAATVTLVEGVGPKARVEVMDYRPAPLRLGTPATSSPRVRAAVVERPDVYRPGWRHVIEIEAVEGLPADGEFRETVVVPHDSPGRPPITIWVTVRLEGRIEVNPSPLYLRPDPGGGLVGRLYFRDRLGKPVSVTPPDIPGAAFTVADAGPKVAVTVRLPAAGPVAAPVLLAFKVDQPCVRTVNVLVRW